VVLSTKQPSAIWNTLKRVVVSNANAKRCESVMTLRSRSQAPTALRLKKPVTSAVVVGKVGHREKIMLAPIWFWEMLIVAGVSLPVVLGLLDSE